MDIESSEKAEKINEQKTCGNCGSANIESYSESPEDRPYVIVTHNTCRVCRHYWYEED